MTLESSPRAAALRSRPHIARALEPLLDRAQKTVSFLEGGTLLFDSHLLEASESRGRIVFERSRNEAANRTLLGQSRCVFSASADGWRIEFVAGAPRTSSDTAGAIELDFPDVLTRWRRSSERTPVSPGVPLQCVADSEGVMPFDALVVDIGAEGLGFLIHAQSVALEPGTVLRRCRVDMPGRASCKVDLEVCYSQTIVLGDGSQSVRSGCRFVDTTGAAGELIRFYLGSLGGQPVPAGEPQRDLV